LEYFSVYSHIKWALIFLILADKTGMFQKEVAKTIFVAVLRTEMAGSISVNIFGIDICSSHENGLDYT
jgi:hypothetical protein